MEMFNDNSISYVAAAFFTGLFGLLSIVAKGVFDTRREARDKMQIISRLDTRLNRIEKTLNDHMVWHVKQSGRKYP